MDTKPASLHIGPFCNSGFYWSDGNISLCFNVQANCTWTTKLARTRHFWLIDSRVIYKRFPSVCLMVIENNYLCYITIFLL